MLWYIDHGEGRKRGEEGLGEGADVRWKVGGKRAGLELHLGASASFYDVRPE